MDAGADTQIDTEILAQDSGLDVWAMCYLDCEVRASCEDGVVYGADFGGWMGRCDDPARPGGCPVPRELYRCDAGCADVDEEMFVLDVLEDPSLLCAETSTDG